MNRSKIKSGVRIFNDLADAYSTYGEHIVDFYSHYKSSDDFNNKK